MVLIDEEQVRVSLNADSSEAVKDLFEIQCPTARYLRTDASTVARALRLPSLMAQIHKHPAQGSSSVQVGFSALSKIQTEYGFTAADVEDEVEDVRQCNVKLKSPATDKEDEGSEKSEEETDEEDDSGGRKKKPRGKHQYHSNWVELQSQDPSELEKIIKHLVDLTVSNEDLQNYSDHRDRLAKDIDRSYRGYPIGERDAEDVIVKVLEALHGLVDGTQEGDRGRHWRSEHSFRQPKGHKQACVLDKQAD